MCFFGTTNIQYLGISSITHNSVKHQSPNLWDLQGVRCKPNKIAACAEGSLEFKQIILSTVYLKHSHVLFKPGSFVKDSVTYYIKNSNVADFFGVILILLVKWC